MRIGQEVAHHTRRLASVDEVVDDEHAVAAAAAFLHDLRGDALEHLQLALAGVVVARNADRLDEANLKLAGHDRSRHQAAARHRNDRLKRPGAVEPPGKGARVAMELVPGDRKCLFRHLHRRHGTFPLSSGSSCASFSAASRAVLTSVMKRSASLLAARTPSSTSCWKRSRSSFRPVTDGFSVYKP